MLMTKEQARQVWCPMVRLAAINPAGCVEGGQAVINRLQNGNMTACPDSSMCIADKCAMWRWSPSEDHDGHDGMGYCGLAGRPA